VVAAQRGARQVFFAVIATTVVLIAVFAPLPVPAGLRRPAVCRAGGAIAAAVAFPPFLALSLSPMLASKLLRPAQGQGWLARRVDVAMNALRDSYRASLEMLLGRRSARPGRGRTDSGDRLLRGWIVHDLAARTGAVGRSRTRRHPSGRAREGAGYDYMAAQALKLEPIMADLTGPEPEKPARLYLVSVSGLRRRDLQQRQRGVDAEGPQGPRHLRRGPRHPDEPRPVAGHRARVTASVARARSRAGAGAAATTSS
jgi:multidrug efflux pump